MRRHARTQVLLLLLTGTVMLVGYLVFRRIYQETSAPLAQEILLMFLGSIVTVLVTAMLLNRQTELELQKEGRVLLLQQKNEIYLQVIEHIAAMARHRALDEVLVQRLRVLNHKLAVVGSAEVVQAFNEVLDRLLAGLPDDLSDEEAEEIMHTVARVTLVMRRDLLGEEDVGVPVDITAAVLSNSRDVEEIDDLEAEEAAGRGRASRPAPDPAGA